MDDGKGLVAVVRGLRDSGVSVMIISRKHLMNSLKSVRRPGTSSATGTSMEYHVDKNTTTQICAERYCTSYQLAHCHFNCTPRKEFREFPTKRDRLPQRIVRSAATSASQQEHVFALSLRRYPLASDRSESSELVQRLLNYTQTKYFSKNSSTNMRPLHRSRPRQYKEYEGSGVIDKPRAIKNHSKSKKHNDLNKSTEGKITETNCRVLKRPSCESKAPKETVTKTDSESIKNRKIQSYTRKMTRKDSTSTRAPYQNSRYNHKSNPLNESYNYLRASCSGKRSYTGRNAELRYLNEIKQFLQDYLRQLRSVENGPICPNMMNRYNQHRKKIHGISISPDEEAQADRLASPSKDFSGSYGYSPPLSTQSSRLYKRIPRPHKSEPRKVATVIKLTDTILNFLKKISIYTDESPEIITKRDEMLQQLATKIIILTDQQATNERVKEDILKCLDNLPMWFPGTADDWNRLRHQIADEIVNESYDITSLKAVDDSNEIEGVIHKWLNELPVYSENTPECYNKRREIVKRLSNNLTNLKSRTDFDEIAKNEINICIDSLPMWFPVAKRDQISDNLLNSIKYVMGRDYNEIVDGIDKKIEEQSLEWLKELPVYADETLHNKAKSREMVIELAAKLDSLKGVEDFGNKARNEIDKCIESLPFRFPGTKQEQENIKKQIADNLLDDLSDAIGKSDGDIESSEADVEQTLEWLKKLPVYTDETPQNKAKSREIIKELAAKLDSLKSCDNFENRARKEINNCIENLPLRFPGTKREQGKLKSQIADNLLGDLNGDINKSNRGIETSDKEVERQTIEWLKELPVYADETTQNKAKSKEMVKELAAKLNSFKDRDSFENRAKYEIERCIESLPLTFPGTIIEQKILKNQIVHNLLDDLSDVIGKSHRAVDAFDRELEEETLELPAYAGEIPQNKAESKDIVKNKGAPLNNPKSLDNFKNTATDDIHKGIDSLPLKIPGIRREQEKFKYQITDSLLNNLNKVMGEGKEYKNKIIEDQTLELFKRVCVYEELSPKSKEKIKEMANKLSKELNSIKEQNYYDNKTQEMIKTYIANIVTMISNDIAGNISDNDIDELRTMKRDSEKSMDKLRATKNRKDNTVNRVKEQLLDWLNELPVYSGYTPKNKAKTENIVQQLADKLENIKSHDDFEEEAKAEIQKCIESLPFTLPGTKINQDILKDQIVDYMLNNLYVDELSSSRNLSRKSSTLFELRRVSNDPVDTYKNVDKDQIYEWLKKLPIYIDETPQNKVDKEKKVKQLVSKLDSLKDRENYDERARDEISKYINSLPMSFHGDKKDQENSENRMAGNLFDELHSADINNLKNAVKRYFDDINFEDSYGNNIDKEFFLDDFVKNLKPTMNKCPEELKEEVIKMLQKLPPKEKYKVSKIANDLVNELKHIKNDIYKGEANFADANEINVKNIRDWLENSKNVPKQIKIQNENVVKNYKDKVNKMQSEGYDDDVIEEEIKNFLNKLPGNGMLVNPKEKSQLVKNLLNETKSIPNQGKSRAHKEKLPQPLNNEISQLVDDLPINVSLSKRERIKEKIDDLLAQNVNSLSDSEKIRNEIEDILKKEGKMSAYEAKDLASTLINRVKDMLLPNRYTDLELKDNVKEEVITILDDFNIPIEDAEKMEDSLAQVLADQIVSGTNDTEEQIISILQNANLPDDDVRNITNRLTKTNRENLISDRSRDSVLKQLKSLSISEAIRCNKKPGFTTSTSRKDKFYTSPKRFSMVKSSQSQILHDDEFTERKIENKGTQIQSPNMVPEVKDLISKWTQAVHPKLVPTTEQNQVKSPPNGTSLLSQDTNQFIAENLKGVILDWLKQQPLYISRTSYEKLVQEHLLTDLVEGLNLIIEKTPITEINTDKLMIDEIIKHLIRFPMDAQNKSDKNYVPGLARQLLDYLKNSQLFKDISIRPDLQEQSRTTKDYQQQLLDVISKTLLFHDLSADEQLSFDMLKNELVDAFINLHNAGNNEEKKNEHRKKINESIDKYCDDYLKNHPDTPIDRNKLKLDLHFALKNNLRPSNELKIETQRDTDQHFLIPEPMQQKTDQHYVVPPCSILNAEDRAHLERIRERSGQNLCSGPGICGGLRECSSLGSKQCLTQLRNSSVQTSSHKTQVAGSQIDLTPHVVVKEYYWDSVNTYTESPTRIPSAPCPALFTPLCKSMLEQTLPQCKKEKLSQLSCSYSPSVCHSPCGSILGQTLLKPQRDIIISQRPSQFSPLSCHCSSQTQRSQNCSGYKLSPSQLTYADFPCSRSRTGQNLPQFQRYMCQRESRLTTPIASKSCLKSSMSCSPQPLLDKQYVSSQTAPCTFHHRIPCSPKPGQPWYMKKNVPFTSETYETDESLFRKSRVSHLGSFDHVEPKVCKARSYTLGKYPRNNNNFRDESYKRCFPLDEDSETCVNERHNNLRVRCRGKESTLPKCSEGKINRFNVNSTNNCCKCCSGVHCPYPSHMFFKQ